MRNVAKRCLAFNAVFCVLYLQEAPAQTTSPFGPNAVYQTYVSISDTIPVAQGIAPPSNASPNTTNIYGEHLVSFPNTSDSTQLNHKNNTTKLVVFLPDAGQTPSAYGKLSSEAALSTGAGGTTSYGVLTMAYPGGLDPFNSIEEVCKANSPCYGSSHGEALFGHNVVYPGLSNAWSAPTNSNNPAISQADSLVNRLVLLLDCLSYSQATCSNPNPAYWQSFLLDDSQSSQINPANCYLPPSQATPARGCYVAPHDRAGNLNYTRKVVPDWSRIIIAGHSQGASRAAFLAMNIPGGVRRALLFSGPQDNTGSDANPTFNANGQPLPGTSIPAWMSAPSQTPLTSFWSLRNASGNVDGSANNLAEGSYGNNVAVNLRYLSASAPSYSSQAVGVAAWPPVSVVDGSHLPSSGSRNLYVTFQATPLVWSNHGSSAIDANSISAEATTWDWMLSSEGTD